MIFDRGFVFAGNRWSVLEAMLDEGLDVREVLLVPNPFVSNRAADRGVEFRELTRKEDVVEALHRVRPSCFVSNGCPFILPAGRLAADTASLLLNVHPSALPALRGPEPVIGALLSGGGAGASCHLMTDDVDGGPLIAREALEVTPELDADLLYRAAFAAEARVFRTALRRGFAPDPSLTGGEPSYFRPAGADSLLDFRCAAVDVVRKVRAFSTASLGVQVHVGSVIVTAHGARVLDGDTVHSTWPDAVSGQVVACYRRTLVVRAADDFVALEDLMGPLASVAEGVVVG